MQVRLHWGFEFILKQNIFKLPFPGSMDVNLNYTWSNNLFADFIDNEQVLMEIVAIIPSNIGHTFIKGNHWNN